MSHINMHLEPICLIVFSLLRTSSDLFHSDAVCKQILKLMVLLIKIAKGKNDSGKGFGGS